MIGELIIGRRRGAPRTQDNFGEPMSRHIFKDITETVPLTIYVELPDPDFSDVDKALA